MIKKTVKYTDFNGVEQAEDLYFNLTKTELTKLEMSKEGGLSAYIESIVPNSKDSEEAYNIKIAHVSELFELLEMIILASYGKKSEDGKSFLKSKELTENFKNSLAYDELFYSICSDSNEAVSFIQGVFPADVQRMIAENGPKISAEDMAKINHD